MTKTLYFGNLSWGVTDDGLTQAVSSLTEVISARVVTDRDTGRSRGFGFVEIPADDAQRVIDALNGTMLDGREIVVNESRERAPRRPAGRRY
ncbi:MAG: RNA-binding protein [Bacillota bacterium]